MPERWEHDDLYCSQCGQRFESYRGDIEEYPEHMRARILENRRLYDLAPRCPRCPVEQARKDGTLLEDPDEERIE